jgi:predicted DNA-binding transcriptional regulator YafY
VLVVHHAEEVAEWVDDRRGDEAGPALDRGFVRCRTQGQQPPEAGLNVVHMPVDDRAAGLAWPAGRCEPAIEDAELVLVVADTELGVGEPAFRADAEAAASAIMIDPTRWGERDRSRPEVLDQLQAAVIRQRKVRLTYTDSARVRSERLIAPWGLVDKDEIWYLIAGTEQGQRTFRVDRILEAEPTDQPAARPDDFTLASAWEQVVGEVEQRRSRTWATVLIEARFVPVLRDHFGRHCHAGSQLGDGRARVRIAAPTPLDIARNLAGWGAMIEVIEPRIVQAELARIGAELAGRYGPPEGESAD